MSDFDINNFTELASERVGGKVLSTSDDFFAEKENLLKAGRGVFIADKYTDRGKWMDGWESRRKRTPGHDHCIIRLGLPGQIFGFDIDTNHFLGNHPPFASVDACFTMSTPKDSDWVEILPKSSLKPGSQNLFKAAGGKSFNHLRLNIYPDGGVARFRVYGIVQPDWTRFDKGEIVDLVAVQNGGRSIICNDMFFSHKDNLIMPGRGLNMGDGWETKRRREPGNDWNILSLGRPGVIRKVEIDTAHFKGNFPDMCSIDGLADGHYSTDDLVNKKLDWKPLLEKTKLQADKQHLFENELKNIGPCRFVRLNIYPDGGISRIRIWGAKE
jgi:allantoicase